MSSAWRLLARLGQAAALRAAGGLVAAQAQLRRAEQRAEDDLRSAATLSAQSQRIEQATRGRTSGHALRLAEAYGSYLQARWQLAAADLEASRAEVAGAAERVAQRRIGLANRSAEAIARQRWLTSRLRSQRRSVLRRAERQAADDGPGPGCPDLLFGCPEPSDTPATRAAPRF